MLRKTTRKSETKYRFSFFVTTSSNIFKLKYLFADDFLFLIWLFCTFQKEIEHFNARKQFHRNGANTSTTRIQLWPRTKVESNIFFSLFDVLLQPRSVSTEQYSLVFMMWEFENIIINIPIRLCIIFYCFVNFFFEQFSS